MITYPVLGYRLVASSCFLPVSKFNPLAGFHMASMHMERHRYRRHKFMILVSLGIYPAGLF